MSIKCNVIQMFFKFIKRVKRQTMCLRNKSYIIDKKLFFDQTLTLKTFLNLNNFLNMMS